MEGGTNDKFIMGPMGKSMFMGCFQGIVAMCKTYGTLSTRAKVRKGRHPNVGGEEQCKKI